MVFNVTFNNISVISWWSVLLMEETGGHGENHRPDKLYHIMLCTSHLSRFEFTTSVVIGTECIGICKSNYHTITATTTPHVQICIYCLYKGEDVLSCKTCIKMILSGSWIIPGHLLIWNRYDLEWSPLVVYQTVLSSSMMVGVGIDQRATCNWLFI
jgi:hypothetical protein